MLFDTVTVRSTANLENAYISSRSQAPSSGTSSSFKVLVGDTQLQGEYRADNDWTSNLSFRSSGRSAGSNPLARLRVLSCLLPSLACTGAGGSDALLTPDRRHRNIYVRRGRCVVATNKCESAAQRLPVKIDIG
jgi:hypothetical protein